MTTVVLLVLAGIWVVVLVAPLVRARADGSLGDSIGSFRRHLSVLERAAPTTVAPANRLRTPRAQVAVPPFQLSVTQMRRPVAAGRLPSSYRFAVSRALVRRRQAQRRRRDILLALLIAMAGSLLLAFLPGLGVMMWAHVGIDLLSASYVALLIHMRNQAAEQEMKLTFLPSHAAPAVPAVPAVPAGYREAVEGYGSVLARQAAN